MTENKIKYLLGIDGGGTKTEFLLTDLSQNKINRIVLGASNPVNIGLEAAKAVIKEGIDAVCDGVNLSEVSAFAGIAGCGSAEIKASVAKFLLGFGFGAFSNGTDADNAVSTALKGENGVAVIMGTGIVAFGSLNGSMSRAGGRGYMIDKGGSGFCYGSDALNCAFEHLDGRGGSEAIAVLVEKMIEKPLTDSVSDIYEKGSAYVASFAPVVFDAYKNGDKKAEEIIDRNSGEAAKIISAACGDSCEKRRNIVILGGLCNQKDIIEPFIMKHLGGEYVLHFSDEPAVNGAVLLAKSNLR